MVQPRLTMFGIIVEDLARSLKFYRLLGMEFPEGADASTDIVIPISENLQMFFTSTFIQKNDPNHVPPAGGYRALIEFFVDTDEEIEELYASLTAAGYAGHRAPFRASFGPYMAMVDDPDGNTVLLTSE